MQKTIKTMRDFFTAEDGLVTVEWVALASALVVGAIAVGWLVMNDLKVPAAKIASTITDTASTTPSSPSP
jgi:hypothetical protein